MIINDEYLWPPLRFSSRKAERLIRIWPPYTPYIVSTTTCADLGNSIFSPKTRYEASKMGEQLFLGDNTIKWYTLNRNNQVQN
jgi:hypothetical protein